MSKRFEEQSDIGADTAITVIRRSLQYAASDGLPGEHHFYITFRTDDDGVVIPDYLRPSIRKR